MWNLLSPTSLLKLRALKGAYFQHVYFSSLFYQFLAEGGCLESERVTVAVSSLDQISIHFPLTVLQKLHTVFMKHWEKSPFEFIWWLGVTLNIDVTNCYNPYFFASGNSKTSYFLTVLGKKLPEGLINSNAERSLL